MKGGRILGNNKITSDMGIPFQYVNYRYPSESHRLTAFKPGKHAERAQQITIYRLDHIAKDSGIPQIPLSYLFYRLEGFSLNLPFIFSVG